MLCRLLKWVAFACLSPSLSTVLKKMPSLDACFFFILTLWVWSVYFIAKSTKSFVLHTADDPFDAVDISVGIKQNAVWDLSISAGSSWLLIVTLHWLRQTGVDHVAHIRLIYSHAEGYGGTDHLKDTRKKKSRTFTKCLRVYCGSS